MGCGLRRKKRASSYLGKEERGGEAGQREGDSSASLETRDEMERVVSDKTPGGKRGSGQPFESPLWEKGGGNQRL